MTYPRLNEMVRAVYNNAVTSDHIHLDDLFKEHASWPGMVARARPALDAIHAAIAGAQAWGLVGGLVIHLTRSLVTPSGRLSYGPMNVVCDVPPALVVGWPSAILHSARPLYGLDVGQLCGIHDYPCTPWELRIGEDNNDTDGAEPLDSPWRLLLL